MSKSGLGKALKNRVEKKYKVGTSGKAPMFYQQTEQNDAELKKLKMKSVIDQNSLNDFLQTAELSQTNFQANRDIKFKQIRQQIKNRKIILVKDKEILIEDEINQTKLKGLQIPRRPNWKKYSNKQQLENAENQTYLKWRRDLAQLQQKNSDISITPYEKNIEVWRQLWRVTERADLMVQIVDGRDPLFFRSEDLTEYVKSLNMNKKSLLLINKSDLVPPHTREFWNKYFIQQGINHIFFSAKLANAQNSQSNEQESEKTYEESEDNVEQQIMDQYFNKYHILTINQLTSIFNYYCLIMKKEKIQVGLVGYPNVGKSSVINSLFGKKKVGVASMPGKTKHFQTLNYTEKVTLCDCPGLVFPRISASHAYMVLNGLYPIDALKSFENPMKILVQRIPQKQISKTYGLHWKQSDLYNCETVLNKYSTLKGFFTGSGVPNQAIAARNILKDYVNGVLAYARNPPGLIGEEVKQSTKKEGEQNSEEKPVNMKKMQMKMQEELDNQFFKEEKEKQLTSEDYLEHLTEDDLLDIIEGKKVIGIKITKEMRKNIKFAMKRGEGLQRIKKMYFAASTKDDPKNLIKN